MNSTVETVFQAALALPPADRQALTEALLAIEDHPEGPALAPEAYLAEIRQRSTQTGTEAWVPWAEIRRRVHSRLGLGKPNHG